MSRASLQPSTLAFVTFCACATMFACSSDTASSPEAGTRVQATQPVASPTSDALERAKVDEPSSDPVAALPEITEPVLASTTPVVPAKREASPATDLRSPSLLPDGTPEANVAAFTELPLRKSDKAPVAGAGASGIHLDVLEVGKGWAASRCEDLDSEFDVGADSRVNVCFRVVHPRVDETVTVEWARDGKLRQSIEVRVKPTHAYRTRAWLPVSAGRAGDWTATVKSEDGFVLGQVGFRITD